MRYREFILSEAEFAPFEGAITFNDWTEFSIHLQAAIKHGFSTPEELCSLVGYPFDKYTRLIDHSIDSWRESTTTSLLHGIADLNIPKPGQQIFPDLIWQTRFLLTSRPFGVMGSPIVKDPAAKERNDRFYMVKGERALTLQGNEGINQLLQGLYLYHFFNDHQTKNVIKKFPKVLYRGVRASDMFNHKSLEDVISVIWKLDKSHEMKRKEAIDVLVNYIVEKGLTKLSDGNILSFSSQESVAKFFANKNGFILKVDPKRVHIVSSEVHDERLAGATGATRWKDEKEYIIRIPDDYQWSKDDVIISDSDYLFAEQNPLCVAYLDHDDKEAIYTLNGKKITAYAYWSSGTSLKLIFTSEGHYGYSRGEFKKHVGFDPLPTEKNLSDITNFVVRKKKRW